MGSGNFEKVATLVKEEIPKKRGRPKKEEISINPEIKEITLESAEYQLNAQLKGLLVPVIDELLGSLAKATSFKAVNFLVLDKLYRMAKTEKIGETEGKIYVLELLIKLHKTNDENRRNLINDMLAEYIKGARI
jgi:hypothetical protein